MSFPLRFYIKKKLRRFYRSLCFFINDSIISEQVCTFQFGFFSSVLWFGVDYASMGEWRKHLKFDLNRMTTEKIHFELVPKCQAPRRLYKWNNTPFNVLSVLLFYSPCCCCFFNSSFLFLLAVLLFGIHTKKNFIKNCSPIVKLEMWKEKGRACE